jgi:hypothetical protein
MIGGESRLVIAKLQIVDYWAPQENFEEKAKARKLGREDEARSDLTVPVRKVGDNTSASSNICFVSNKSLTQLK